MTDENDPPFSPRPDPESAVANAEFESNNVCRTAALGLVFGSAGNLRGLESELSSLGLPPELATRNSVPWELAGQNLDSQSTILENSRVDTFRTIRTSGELIAIISFLQQVLCSNLERESTAAAGAIWNAAGRRVHRPDLMQSFFSENDRNSSLLMFGGFERALIATTSGNEIYANDPESQRGNPWLGEEWSEAALDFLSRPWWPSLTMIRLEILAFWRLVLALRSSDIVTREFAMAATADWRHSAGRYVTNLNGRSPKPGAITLSVLVHGTWGWKGDWWRPGSDFHQFVYNDVRSNLYSRGAPFSWSGAYSSKQRELAVQDFLLWANEISPRGIETLIGHSYGGEVAVRAWNCGAKIAEVVLLSTPVTDHVLMAVDNGLATIDIRLPFDPVLALARTPQRILRKVPNLRKVTLPEWRLSHGATHDPDAWREHALAKRAGL